MKTEHYGVRKQGANIWPTPGREWEVFHRDTGERTGPLFPTRYEAVYYAYDREGQDAEAYRLAEAEQAAFERADLAYDAAREDRFR